MRRLPVILVTTAALGAMLYVGLRLISIDADITSVLPQNDPVVNDARYVLKHHPALDRVYLDLALPEGSGDRELLVTRAKWVRSRLQASGLFRSVGIQGAAEGLAELYAGLPHRLPVLFTERDLTERVTPLLAPARIDATVQASRRRLLGLEGIGQADAVTRDPLELRNLVMARLARLQASDRITIFQHQLMTKDGRHLLLIAEPKGAGSNTHFARRLTALLAALQRELDRSTARVRITAVGSFRAALDNETIIRRDTQRAVIIATLGIVLLLLTCFPRPLLGLLALIPAAAGGVVALFVYALLVGRISAVALGFGGALISISVDHGIAYLLFLNEEGRNPGHRAAKKVWAVGLIAALTTVCAFLTLTISGFPLLAQVGLFAATGVAASFAFVHLVFPHVFADLRPVRRSPLLPVDRLLAFAGRGRLWPTLLVAGGLVVGLAFFARPRFGGDLESMNTVRADTRAAEQMFRRTWGDLGKRIYVLVEGKTPSDLQRRSDELATLLGASTHRIANGFSPSLLYPGPKRAAQNLAAWKRFWSPARRAELRQGLGIAAGRAGFTAEAFAPFLKLVDQPRLVLAPIPPSVFPVLGIARSRTGETWGALAPVDPAPRFDGERFGKAAAAKQLRVFDSKRFATRLGQLISHTFLLMLAIVGGGVLLLLILMLLDWRLVLAALIPLVVSLVCTLGTLHLLGRPLDIPGLMLAIVVVGMGLDYGIYFVRAHQRFLDPDHAVHRPVRLAVFLAGGSTLLGLGSLVFSEHSVLQSAGVTTSLGILYALVASLVLLPPLLRRIYTPQATPAPLPLTPGSPAHARQLRRRYRHLEPYPRLFARFKLRDPMFPRLAELVEPRGRILDVGCGFGVPAAWLLTCYPELRVLGIELELDRARVAGRALGPGGMVVIAQAEALPVSPSSAQTVLLLDIVHHLDDEALRETLTRARACLAPGGRLVLRTTVASDKPLPWERRLERLNSRLRRQRCRFRDADTLTEAIASAGFATPELEPGPVHREETWFIAHVPKDPR